MEKQKTYPGKHPSFNDSHFNNEEKKILSKLINDFYLTNGGGIIELGLTSKYKYCLFKPTSNYQELFNIEKEIIILFSEYENFEPRTLDAYDEIIKNNQDFRIEKICSLLISKDNKIEDKINNLIATEPEYQVIIPFSYNELLGIKDNFYIRNKFKKYFYSRDLFAFNSPLKRDLYFFGRTDLIHKIVSRYRSNENSGLFGLRKTGKTSIIFGIQRNINRIGEKSVFIDCQNPSFHKKRWYLALNYIINQIKIQNNISVKLNDKHKYTEEYAAEAFEKDFIRISKKINNKSILIIFDEIEHITPKISISDHWKDGDDFILFWQTLRSIYQKNNYLFRYLIVGTNPKSIELPTINGIDNPIYNQVPYQYIDPFTVQDTRTMVRKLGKIMGLKFDEEIYSKLTEDFGGHPFLIRNVCSSINKIIKEERPVRVDKITYLEGVKRFNNEYSNYYEMIISVLKEYYADEYEMLKFLALGDIDSFKEFNELSKEYIAHLMGYRIIDENNGNFFFKIESLKEYLKTQNKYKKINTSQKERSIEISSRRNHIEPKLRKIVRMVLVMKYGENEAKKITLKIMGKKREDQYYSQTLKNIYDSNSSIIYLEDLRKIIIKEWELFKNIFGNDKDAFNNYLTIINKYRIDAHAKNIKDDEFNLIRIYFDKIEKLIENYE